MNSTFNNIIIYNGYPLSIVVAVTFHILVLAALLYLQTNNSIEGLNLVQPTIITALFIDENPQLRNAQTLERQRLERLDRERIAREQEQLSQEAEAQRQAEAERLRQQQRERSALIERQELDRLRAEQLLREQDRQQLDAEEQRQQDLAAAERQRQAESERQRQQAATEAATAQAARTELQLIQSATGIIQQVVQQNWSRPPSARNGMRAILQIRMLPTGELIEVIITQSSGDAAFDRSAETAVYRAAPFRELQALPINIFNQNFRSLSLIFEPEDLLN